MKMQSNLSSICPTLLNVNSNNAIKLPAFQINASINFKNIHTVNYSPNKKLFSSTFDLNVTSLARNTYDIAEKKQVKTHKQTSILCVRLAVDLRVEERLLANKKHRPVNLPEFLQLLGSLTLGW